MTTNELIDIDIKIKALYNHWEQLQLKIFRRDTSEYKSMDELIKHCEMTSLMIDILRSKYDEIKFNMNI